MCGYVLAVLDSRQFYKQFAEKWTPSVLSKYPTSDEGLTSAEKVWLNKKRNNLTLFLQDVLKSLRQSKFFLPAELYDQYPSHLHIDLMKRAQGKGTGGRMIRCVLSALKAKGMVCNYFRIKPNLPRPVQTNQISLFDFGDFHCV